MKITERLLEEIACIYCTFGTPLWILANNYGVSKTTLVRYFKGDRAIKLPEHLQKEVDERKKQNFDEYKSTYGNLGNTYFTNEQIIELANKMIIEEMTLSDASTFTGLSASTIYSYLNEEVLGFDLYQQILELYKSNKDKRIGESKNASR